MNTITIVGLRGIWIYPLLQFIMNSDTCSLATYIIQNYYLNCLPVYYLTIIHKLSWYWYFSTALTHTYKLNTCTYTNLCYILLSSHLMFQQQYLFVHWKILLIISKHYIHEYIIYTSHPTLWTHHTLKLYNTMQ